MERKNALHVKHSTGPMGCESCPAESDRAASWTYSAERKKKPMAQLVTRMLSTQLVIKAR